MLVEVAVKTYIAMQWEVEGAVRKPVVTLAINKLQHAGGHEQHGSIPLNRMPVVSGQ